MKPQKYVKQPTMPKRIDHAGGAMTHIEYVHEWQGEAGDMEENQLANAFIAQAEATLALVEQQRIANLIALGVIGGGPISRESPKHVIDYLLSDYPEVAAALGIKEGNHAE